MSRSKPNLSIEERNTIVQWIQLHCTEHEDMRLESGQMKLAVAKFGVHRQSIWRIWKEAKNQRHQGKSMILGNNKIGTTRSTKIQFNPKTVKAISMKERRSLQGLATKLNVSKSTIWRWSKSKLIKPHTNAIKPFLTTENMMHRLSFCLKHLQVDQVSNVIEFKSMQHIVHIDEKWFYLTKEIERYYIVEGEQVVHRTCKSKRFITKVMFMCAVARPLYNVDGQVLFDGKIGVFPFTKQVPAMRKSKNRPRGTFETKPIESITREVTKRCIIDQVLPAIKAKWPDSSSKSILIQQDNCMAHINDDDPEFRVVASSDGFNIHLVNQPPNSPDTNINDLGWFRALHTLQHEHNPQNFEDLVKAVKASFEMLESYKLNKVFITYQACMIETMNVMGHKNYQLPHMGKDSLFRKGELPTDLEVDVEMVNNSLDILRVYGEEAQCQGLEELMLGINYT